MADNPAHKEIWIVTELLDAGSLLLYCFGDERNHISAADKVEVGVQCWSALCYLHIVAKVAHMDIKPQNIVVSYFVIVFILRYFLDCLILLLDDILVA